MNTVKLTIFIIYLVAALGIAGFNWLFLKKTIDSHNGIGIHSPKRMHVAVKSSMLLAGITVTFIVIFILSGYY